ncbi:MAG TPA: hypothetical protein VGM65_15980 [Candidatus Udaeobacter sp.]|jgi:hypothetical protein
MSSSAEQPERLAKILGEMIALSNPTRTKDSGPSQTHDPTELLGAQSVNGVDEAGASRGEEAGRASRV